MNSISIIHPSRQRPQMALITATKWLCCASKETKLEYILSIDETDPTLDLYFGLFTSLKKEYSNIKFCVKNNKSCIDASNNGALVSENNIIILVSDDFDCFEGWDVWLMEKLDGKKDYVVKTSDMLQKWLITLPIMDREYYNRFGYIYYPGYKHLFCDTEMTEVGHLLGRVIDLQDGEHHFRHKHWTAGLMQRDIVNEKNDATWNQGETLFNERKQINFELL